MDNGKSRANAIRETKRSEILKSLQARGLIQQVLETTEKLADLTKDLTSVEVQRIVAANNTRLALIKKYLPDLKQTELVGDKDRPLETKHTVEFVEAKGDKK